MRPLRRCFQRRGYSPRGLRTLHRVLVPIARSGGTSSLSGTRSSRLPLLRFFAPPALPAQSVHLFTRTSRRLPRTTTDSSSERRGFASPASFHPRRFTRPRRLPPLCTLPTSPPAHTPGVSHPPGDFPSRRGLPCHQCRLPLMAFAVLPPADSGLDPRVRGVTSRLQGIARRVDRLRQLSVSRPLGLDPSWASLLRTASLPRPPVARRSEGSAAPSRVQTVKEQQLVVGRH